MIICSSLLHEVENPKEFLTEIHKASNKGTVVHINVPNANSFHRVLAQKAGLIRDLKMLSDRNLQLQQHTVFDIESLKKIVSDVGFSILESGQYFLKPFTHAQMEKMMQAEIIDEKVLEGLYEMGKDSYGSEIYVNAVITTC